jgi:hypothetical protein
MLGALALGGCDAATQIAGEAVQGEIRNAVSSQCAQVAEGAGIVADRIAAVCECTAAAVAADKAVTLEDVVPSRIEGVVNQCAAETAGTTNAVDQQTPTE